ncbi:MAG: hypothetical protein WC465_01420 [Patescibacteria group bacterium]
MFKVLLPFISSIWFLASWWWFFYYQRGVGIIAIVSAILIILTGRFIAKSQWWSLKGMWLNFLWCYFGQFLFLLLLKTEHWRYILAFVFSALWSAVWFLVIRYSRNVLLWQSKDYLVFRRFWYYFNFWLLSSSAYALVIFVGLPMYYSAAVLLLVVLLSGYDLSTGPWHTRWLNMLLLFFIMLQLVLVIYFLPVNFYVAGALLSLWFFFISDSIVEAGPHFLGSLTLFMLANIVLLATSLFNL